MTAEMQESREEELQSVTAEELRVAATVLLRNIHVDEWQRSVFPVIKKLNTTLTSPLAEKQLRELLQTASVRALGDQVLDPVNRKKLSPIWTTELLSMPSSKVEWLVDGLLPVGTINVLSGDPGSFKTWTLLHIATQVAKGDPVFGQFKTKKGRALILDEENRLELLKERLEKLGASNEEVCFSSQFGFKVDNTDDMKALTEFIVKNDIKLVMIDSLVRVNSKDENVAREVADMFVPLKKLVRDGTTVLLTHHHRKQSATGRTNASQSLRGSSDILAAVDTHIAVTHKKADKRLMFEQSKSRFAKEIDPFEVTIVESQSGSISLDYEGVIEKELLTKDQAKQQILDFLSNGPATRTDIEAELNLLGKNAIATALRELVAEGKVEAKTGPHGKKTYSVLDPDPQLT